MEIDSLPDNLTKSDGHSIADHAANRFEAVFAVRLHEFVVGRE